ncbi:MAG TPA: hypothetical protein VJP45_12855 [Candidatus Limnocylindria bacterium]|nr:hypothetical protein [Candidatus Limnocylindria bacterium]
MSREPTDQNGLDTDEIVEQQTAVALPQREAMSIVDLSLGPKIFPQSPADPPLTTDQGIDESDPAGGS